MTSAIEQRDIDREAVGYGTQLPYDALREPGTYVCNWSGHLLRVPPDAVKPGRYPCVAMTGARILYLTKISDDPFLPVEEARLLAADHDQNVNF